MANLILCDPKHPLRWLWPFSIAVAVAWLGVDLIIYADSNGLAALRIGLLIVEAIAFVVGFVSIGSYFRFILGKGYREQQAARRDGSQPE